MPQHFSIPRCYFHARHLTCLAFCKLQVGIFHRSLLFIDWIHRFNMLKSCCESSLKEVFLARHAIFLGNQEDYGTSLLARRYCWLALSRHKKNKLETVQWKKLRKWNVITDLHWKNFSKSQVSVMRRFWVICQNVSRKFIELCMETPCWCTTLVHQHGRQIIWNSLLRWKGFLFARELLYMRINTSPKTLKCCKCWKP